MIANKASSDTISAMLHPTDVKPVGKDEVLVAWNDGHRSLFACRDLRLHCPCAECRDEWTGKRLIRHEQIKADIQMSDLSPVGRYGLKFVWSDRHQTGIYSFEYLRSLCACAECKLTPKGEGE